MPRFYTDQKNLRVTVDGILLRFYEGRRFVADTNTREIEAVKNIPIALAEVRDRDGNVVNIPKDNPLKLMTLAQLKEHAEINKIDLGDATKKADIFKILL